MEEFITKHKLMISEYTFLLLGLICSIFNIINIAIFFLIIASVLFIKIVKDIVENYISFTVLFSCFHVLYGLSGVISQCWLNQISLTYGNTFVYSPYLIAYSLCTMALLTGIVIANKKYSTKKIINAKPNRDIGKYFLFVAYCGFALVSLCEIINFIRAGGMSTLLSGKAIYQAAVDELKFTLPTQYMFQVSLASLGTYAVCSIKNNKKISVKEFMICMCIALPYIITILILGRRGPLLAIMLIFLVSFSLVKPLKKISIKLVILLFIVYLLLATILMLREDIGLLFTDFNQFKEKFSFDYVLKHFNPAMTEFGCTYGNFNKFYIKNDYELLYGKSYIQGLTHVIPSYLYPGEKPEMITYVFRDKYFPAKSEISSIASTGFSSILETYWNFWYFGAIMYLLYGFLLIILEKKIKNGYFGTLEYISLITIVYYFHRSDFGYISSNIILTTTMVIIIYLFYMAMQKFIPKMGKRINIEK